MPGTGRPKGSLEASGMYARETRIRLCELVAARLDEMVEAMIEKAVQGDVNAFTAVMDRAHGKPAQAVEVSGADGNPIVFMPLELIQKHALQVAEKMAQSEEKPLHVEAKVIDNGSTKP